MPAKKSVGQRLVSGLSRLAEDLKTERAGIRGKYTCHSVNLHLHPREYSQNDVREIRELLGVSQAILGEFLGVSVKTVQAWEQGVNRPQRSARRFMDEIRRAPRYWRDRIEALMTESA